MHVHGSWDSKAMEDNHVRSLWLVVVAVVVLMQAEAAATCARAFSIQEGQEGRGRKESRS